MNTSASATLISAPAVVRNIGVLVSPAARIADVPMSHTVAAPFAPPTTVRKGAPIATTSSLAPRRRRRSAEKNTKPTPNTSPAIAPSTRDCRVASAASAGRPSPIRRLTIAIVPMASDRHTGNIKNRKFPAAPAPAVAVAPRCPTSEKTTAVASALTDCSMIPGHASSSAARAGERRASSAARVVGPGASSSTSSAVWMLTR